MKNDSRFETHRDKALAAAKKAGADAFLVTNFTNVTYLTGFTGDDSHLLLRDGGPWILSDGRYRTQLEEECPGLEQVIRQPGTSMAQWVAKALHRPRSAGWPSRATR